ncbi:hypothetical protein [Haladaptatus sp. CMAA 1911]|uniref:hypothetical protein n=1 Tax=unclassified Haladaptatus TaxID=2622732 RepID=UPI00375467DA
MLFRVLCCLFLVGVVVTGVTAAQSTPTSTGNNTTANNSSTNQTAATTRPTVNPYGSGYLNETGKYNSNNSTLGVYNNSTGMQGSGGGMFYNAILDAFLAVLGYFVSGLFRFINATLNAAIKMVTFTPAPSWGSGWYQSPDNMVWPEKYHDWKTTGQPWTFFIAISSTCLYLALGRRGLGILPARYERAGTKNVIIAWLMAFWGWQFVGFALNIGNALTLGIVGDVTQSTVATNGLKGLLLVGLIAIAFWNIWIVLAVISLVSLRTIGLTALAPWIPFFYALKSVPVRGLGMIGDGLTKLWLMLILVALPISIAISVGFSPMTSDIFGQYGLAGIQLIAMQLGTSLACLVFPYVMLSKGGAALASVGVIGTAPTADGMQQAYQNQRERASEVKATTHQRVTGARDLHRGIRGHDPVGEGGSAYATGEAGRQTVQTYSTTLRERVHHFHGGDETVATDGGSCSLEQLREQRLDHLEQQNNDD